MGEPSLGAPPSLQPPEDRLDSWKEIAAYLNRDVTTVQRWEKREGMPVHRHLHDKMGSVYASRVELDDWARNRNLPARANGNNDHSPNSVGQTENSAVSDAAETTASDAVHSSESSSSILVRARRHKSLLIGALLAVVALVLALVLAPYVRDWQAQLVPRVANPSVQALAVLPLVNLSGDPEQEYFVDGMTEALITELGKATNPRVISRQSVMRYKGSKKGLQEIARELRVDAVVEGAVERSGDQVRLTVHLVRASPESQLWAKEYSRSIRDMIALQDEIAHDVTDEIHAKLTPEERTSLASSRPVDPEAQDDYLRGRYLLDMAFSWLSNVTDKKQYTEQDILKAIGLFKQAIKKDPAYALAYAGLADAYIELGNPQWGADSPKETLSEAKAAATKALELDPSLAEAHFSLAHTLEYDWNWPQAEKEYRQALKLNPNYADAHLEYGRLVQALGRNDEAMTQMSSAIQLDPLGTKTMVVVSYVTYAAREYDSAVKQFESLGDDMGLIWAYREKGMYPEAIAAWQRWKLNHRSDEGNPEILALGAGIYGLEGRKREAQALMDKVRETARHQHVSGFFLAEAYQNLGEKDQALMWLERAYEEHDQWMVFANSYPGLDRLRPELRFQALLRRMNFPQ